MTTVLMQFGDGSSKEIEVSATDPDEAVEEARTWVSDNAWFEVYDESGLETLAEVQLS
jgi:flavin-binding protein dodecin